MVFVIPLVLVCFVLQPGFSAWVDFFFYLLFFVFGYILIADEVFMRAIRRDRRLYLILGVASMLFFSLKSVGVPVFDWLYSPGTPGFYVSWTGYVINCWFWCQILRVEARV